MARRERSRFDPYGMLAALERERVSYVVIGAFARVIEGTDEITHGVDITPSTKEENLRRLDAALDSINARRADGDPASGQPTSTASPSSGSRATAAR